IVDTNGYYYNGTSVPLPGGESFWISGSTAGAGAINGVNHMSSASYGVLGITDGPGNFGAGVLGEQDSLTGENYGVWGFNSSSTKAAAGVYGYVGATTGVIYGVFGHGRSTTGGGPNIFNGAAAGVLGLGPSGFPNGSSNQPAGVLGASKGNIAVQGDAGPRGVRVRGESVD